MNLSRKIFWVALNAALNVVDYSGLPEQQQRSAMQCQPLMSIADKQQCQQNNVSGMSMPSQRSKFVSSVSYVHDFHNYSCSFQWASITTTHVLRTDNLFQYFFQWNSVASDWTVTFEFPVIFALAINQAYNVVSIIKFGTRQTENR